MEGIIGIDMAKRTFDAALLVNNKYKNKTFENNPSGFSSLMSWLSRHHITQFHACMEATGTYCRELANYLYETNHPVSVVNSLRIKGFGRSTLVRTKNDRIDAKLIADFCAKLKPALWKPASLERENLKELVRYLNDLKKMKHQETCRAQTAISTNTKKFLIEHITYLENQITLAEKELLILIKQEPQLEKQHDLLCSIPGISTILSATLLAEVVFEDYSKTRQIASHVGLTPQERSSGTSVRGKPHISKVGNAFMRKSLYMPALCAINFNPVIKTFSQRLKASGKPPKVVITACMRKLICIAAGVIKSNQPFNPGYKKPNES